MEITGLQKSLKEIQSKYPETIDMLFAELIKDWNERSVIGPTTDKTLEYVYRRDGALEALNDALQRFLRA